MLDVPAPGEEFGSSEAGLGTCKDGLDGEPTSRLEPGDGCGSIDGDGLILEGNDGGEAMLKDVAGLEEYAWCGWLDCKVIRMSINHLELFGTQFGILQNLPEACCRGEDWLECADYLAASSEDENVDPLHVESATADLDDG